MFLLCVVLSAVDVRGSDMNSVQLRTVLSLIRSKIFENAVSSTHYENKT